MGSGASAGVCAALRSASDEDLKDAFGTLGDDAKLRLAQVLANSGAAEGDGVVSSGDAEGDGVAPSEFRMIFRSCLGHLPDESVIITGPIETGILKVGTVVVFKPLHTETSPCCGTVTKIKLLDLGKKDWHATFLKQPDDWLKDCHKTVLEAKRWNDEDEKKVEACGGEVGVTVTGLSKENVQSLQELNDPSGALSGSGTDKSCVMLLNDGLFRLAQAQCAECKKTFDIGPNFYMRLPDKLGCPQWRRDAYKCASCIQEFLYAAMSSHVIFAHFGFSLFAELLRHQSRPCLLRVERCGKCISRCCARISSCCRCIFCCLFRCRIRRAGEPQITSPTSAESIQDLVDGATDDTRDCGLKWYWFHLAMQVGFAIREFLAVSHLNGWHWELVLVHIATWWTILLVGREVWHFSKIRYGGEERKIAVDRLLDMLLLPVNIVFFCGVCVRVLKLQPGSQMKGMVSVILECSDIYEALALKSVYVLFVKVVEKEMRSTDVARTEGEFRYFKEFFLYGVLSWVAIQISAVFMKLVLQGLISVYAPTLCYWASNSCTSCEQWFENNFGLALSATTFLLCSFAIAFVLYFELAYSDYLKKIGPGWKFLGVKGIVSVTYTQYILIQLAASPLGWDDTQVYLVHCLLYAAWMPLLATVHTLFAYPFYATMRRDTEQRAEWLEAWLGTLDDSTVVEPPPENAICSRRIGLYLALACFSCVASTWVLIDLVPPSSDILDIPIYNKTCTGQGDVAHFLETSNFHLAMRNDTLQRWSVPGIAGAWLPYCSTAQVACASGYVPTRAPSVQCLPTGLYSPHGSCLAISCGQPLRLPHAQPRTQDIEKQNFSLGVVVHYDCDAGYLGNLKAVCNPNRSWTWSGNCTELTCDAPPSIPHAKPVLVPGKNVSTGTVVRYQCQDMFNGTPTAACGDDGQYVTAGRCKRECGPPPAVPHAAPNFTNPHVYQGWFEGTRCPYVCEPGFEGYVTALCGVDGNYTVAGKCKTVFCGDAPRLPHATPHMDEIKRQNFTFGVTIHYDCEQPRFQGKLEATCNITGRWVVHGNCSEVHCGQPPAVQNATPVQHADAAHHPIAAGTVIRYQCNSTFNGTPTATCGDDGLYVTEGRCTKECGPPPSVPHSSPAIDNALLSAGWLAGMGVKYRCDPGFEGAATAVCTDAGTYTVQGLCKTASAIETAQLYSRIKGLTTAIGVENILLFGAVSLFCWRTGRISGLMSARRATSVSAAVSSPSHELAEGLSGLERPLAGGQNVEVSPA